MAVLPEEIATKMWSIKVSALGEIVADVEDIKQTVALIVFTNPGDVPYLPEFGCGWYNHIDKHINSAAPLMLREIRNAVARWETRATILNSSFQIVDLSTLNLTLELRPNFARETDPASSIFINFELDSVKGVMYLVDQYGRKILSNLGYITITV